MALLYCRLTARPSSRMIMIAVSPKKNTPPPPKVIRLKPSSTDYATFVRTTSAVLGTTGPAARKTRPCRLVLALANMDY